MRVTLKSHFRTIRKYFILNLVLTLLSGCYINARIYSPDLVNADQSGESPSLGPTPPPSIDPAVPVQSVSVSKVYPINGKAWLSYIKGNNGGTGLFDQPDTSCVGNETGQRGCIHGGDKLKFTIDGYSSCSNVRISDALAAFEWLCTVQSNKLFVYSAGIKIGKGLSDLIDFDNLDWLNNSVSVYKGNDLIAQSEPAKWWSKTTENPILLLPDSSTSLVTLNGFSAGSILVAKNSANSKGIAIDQDQIAIVIKETASFTYDGNSNTCNQYDGKPSGADKQIFVCIGSQKFNWIEGTFNDSLAYNLENVFMLVYSNFNRFNKVKVEVGSKLSTLGIWRLSDSNIFTDIQIQNSDGAEWPLYVDTNYNYFDSIKIGKFRNDNGYNEIAFLFGNNNIYHNLNFSNSRGPGINFGGSDNNILTNLTLNAVGWLRMGSNGDVTKHTFSHVTMTNGDSECIFAFWGGEVHNNTYNQFLCSHRSMDLGNAVSDIYSQMGFTNDDNNMYFSINSTSRIVNNVIYRNGTGNICYLDGNPSTCSNVTAGSTASWTSYNGNPMDHFVGMINSDESVNASDSMGIALWTSITDWLGFENFFRSWANLTGRCLSGDTCAIWDLRLKSSDNVFRNKSNNGSTDNEPFVAGSNCPAAVHGNKALTDQQTTPHTFLVNAVEIMNDGIGNDNGLCESNESCLYSPNIGAYQGEGDYKNNGNCVFQNGTVSDVIMYAYPVNGG